MVAKSFFPMTDLFSGAVAESQGLQLYEVFREGRMVIARAPQLSVELQNRELAKIIRENRKLLLLYQHDGRSVKTQEIVSSKC